jgi:SAM-dependent methyltransferase
MAVLAMERLGKIGPESLVLGVGAGVELTIFYLSNLVRWVFTTDLYATAPDEWATGRNRAVRLLRRLGFLRAKQGRIMLEMLTDPARLSPIPCNARRIVVQHMDGRNLRFEDNVFDIVFSSSSIEHFGSRENVSQAAREMGRVLKPGGLLTISTELRLEGQGEGMPGALVFSPEDFREVIIGPSGLVPIDEPSFEVSAQTRSRLVTQDEISAYYAELNAGKPARWKTMPHIVLRSGEYTWTSFHLALTKPA